MILRDLLGDERLKDEKFESFASRFENKEELIEILDEIFVNKRADEWLVMLKEKQIPSGPINDLKNVFDDEHAKSRNMILEYEHPTLGQVKQVLSPVNVGDSNKVDISRAPLYAEHTDYVLREILEYDDDYINSLLENKVVE